MTRSTRLALLTTIFAGVLLGIGGGSAVADDAWHFTVTPYLWLPNINGDLRYDLPDGVLDVETGPNDYLSNLKMMAMVSGDARKGRFSILSDVVYLDFSDEESSVRSVDVDGGAISVPDGINVATWSSFTGTAWTLAGGYAVSRNPDATLDVIAGFRYVGVSASSDWNLSAAVEGPGGTTVLDRTGGVSQDVDLWDGVVGLRGRVNLAERWHAPYYLDAGTGSSALTWQALAGITYSYGWGDVGLFYRHLSIDEKSTGLLQDVRFSGPAAGVTFHF